jgi:hypothetical protein
LGVEERKERAIDAERDHILRESIWERDVG